MHNQKLRPLDRRQLAELISVSRGILAADLVIKNGTVINVYTGELHKADVAIKGKHIASVGGNYLVGESTQVINARGMYICPGYIEPHAHPFQTYNPVTLSSKVLSLGTTTLICDNLFFFMVTDEERLLALWQELNALPVKLLWSVRLDPQTHARERAARFATRRIKRLLDTPLARQVGELTDWPSLLAGDEQMLENIILAGKLGKRVEGHAPGASSLTLNALAAGGVSACHESITGDEAINRLRLGMYVTLRHSSLRPDLPTLLKDILASGVGLWRAMITTDGLTPPSMVNGFTDYLLRLTMEAGVPPVEAYRLATINPATYYRLDDELGGVAPGKLADILLLEDLDKPTPVKVISEGKLVAEKGKTLVRFSTPRWSDYGVVPISGPPKELVENDLVPPAGETAFPVMQLVNPVITRRKDVALPAIDGGLDISGAKRLVYATLLDREGKWACNGILDGFAENLAGMACSSTITGDPLVLGQVPGAMLQATRRLFELGGGLVMVEDGRVIYELELPLGGIMNNDPVDKLIDKCSRFYTLLAERGHKHYDALYTILFLSATHLPEIRLSPSGILLVKEKVVLVPSRAIA